jgi:predicted ferric reductase
MNAARRGLAIWQGLTLPLLLAVCTIGPLVWAWPEELSAARTLGIVLGWAGCGLLFASLLLMLREVRLAAWLGGLERMYRWHHRAGMAAYLLLLAHPLALAVDALPEAPLRAWQSLSPVSQDWPVWLGWLSLVLLMLGLAATFARSLPYATWRWLHVALGLAVLLGLGHLLLLGIDEPVWPLLLIAAALLGWRLLRQDGGLAARPYLVRSVAPVASDMVELTLQPLGDALEVAAGQFVLAAFLAGPQFRGCGEFHPFTVSAVGPGTQLRLAIKALGDCTRHLQSVEPGVLVRLHGGFGHFLAEPPTTPQLWVAGGIGITPFLALLRAAPVSQPTTLLYLYRQPADGAFLAELRALAAANPLLSLRPLASGEALPDLAAVLPEGVALAGCECYLCGPPGLIAAVRRELQQRGISARHLHFENFEFR